jgi:hypothetical protein
MKKTRVKFFASHMEWIVSQDISDNHGRNYKVTLHELDGCCVLVPGWVMRSLLTKAQDDEENGLFFRDEMEND